LDAVLFHRFEDSINPRKMQELTKAKESGLVRKIGVSVYGNDELLLATQDPKIDLIQMPFNLLDSWKVRGPLIDVAKQAGKIVHARSVLLQGLFFRDPEQLPRKLELLGPVLRALWSISESECIPLGVLAIRYALHRGIFDGILIGAETPDQLEQSIRTGGGSISVSTARKIESLNDFY
jgi:aryl-alcohol dehydrogenase-like predicted oxidoreductase